MSTVSRMARTSSQPLTEVVEALKDMFGDGMEDVAVSRTDKLGDASVVLLVFEKYFFRNGNYCSLTVQLTSFDEIQKATLVGSGGGEGLMNVDFGADASFVKKACKKLKELGFAEV